MDGWMDFSLSLSGHCDTACVWLSFFYYYFFHFRHCSSDLIVTAFVVFPSEPRYINRGVVIVVLSIVQTCCLDSITSSWIFHVNPCWFLSRTFFFETYWLYLRLKNSNSNEAEKEDDRVNGPNSRIKTELLDAPCEPLRNSLWNQLIN